MSPPPPLLQIPDYLALDKLAEGAESVLVVGGGFLGSELAVGLASRGKQNSRRYTANTVPTPPAGRGRGLGVVQVFPEEGNLGLVLPRELCKWTTDKVKKGERVGSVLHTCCYHNGSESILAAVAQNCSKI